jgi:hypothetical protein
MIKMPLARARDSLVSLHEVADSSDKFDQVLKLRSGGDTSQKENNKQNESESLNFFESGGDWTICEQDEALKIPEKKRKALKANNPCFPCIFPWSGKDPGDHDYKDEDQFDDEMPLARPLSLRSRSGGILTRTSVFHQIFSGVDNVRKDHYKPNSYLPRQNSAELSKFHVKFSPVTSVVYIRPLQYVSVEERKKIWWQLADFEHFKGEIFLLAKPEEQEVACGALWNHTQHKPKQQQQQQQQQQQTTMEARDEAHPWLANEPTIGTTTAKFESDIGDDEANPSWWQKYAASNQAKQITDSYKKAIKIVLHEQKKQGGFWAKKDPEKIARLYHEYGAWSRDLALAAGASDADAVKTDFDDSKRKTREFFLLKQVLKHDRKVHKHSPEFMIPKGLAQGFLDENDSRVTSQL